MDTIVNLKPYTITMTETLVVVFVIFVILACMIKDMVQVYPDFLKDISNNFKNIFRTKFQQINDNSSQENKEFNQKFLEDTKKYCPDNYYIFSKRWRVFGILSPKTTQNVVNQIIITLDKSMEIISKSGISSHDAHALKTISSSLLEIFDSFIESELQEENLKNIYYLNIQLNDMNNLIKIHYKNLCCDLGKDLIENGLFLEKRLGNYGKDFFQESLDIESKNKNIEKINKKSPLPTTSQFMILWLIGFSALRVFDYYKDQEKS